MNIDFNKTGGLVPVIVQHWLSRQVLMLGYMNEDALQQTQKEGKVVFFSRSKNRLWMKGETSGNYLLLKKIEIDCDADTILVQAEPLGPTCHKGSFTCFTEKDPQGFLYELQQTIAERIDSNDESSYTNQLYRRGINKVAQKVGEEAVELVIESKDNNEELFKNEAADLLYHFLILLKAKNTRLQDIEAILYQRSQK